jgi:catechol 2,3-dioxygenase-like lactoylglutathione lyase family enzyme
VATAIDCIRLCHMNAVVEDCEASVAHFRDLFGADFLLDIPQAEWHAWLAEMGGVIFEFLAPHGWLLNARHGAHHVGVEYQADTKQVRQALAERGIRIVRDVGVALHTHPQDCFGIAFEFYDGSFHDREWPLLGDRRMKPASYWRDEHPLGLTGQKGYTVAVRDLGAAQAFFEDLLGAKVAYCEERPEIGARAVGLQVADTVAELLAPVAAGDLAERLSREGEGVRSTVFGVRDLDQARRYFADRGLETVAGASAASVALPPVANRGLLFEFAE